MNKAEKEKIKTIHASIGFNEEKMWNDPEARVGKTFHYDLKTQFALSESQMKALLSIVLEFRKERPCFEQGFKMERMIENE